METNDNRKVVIELQDVKRDFMVGDETVHALRGVSFKIYEVGFRKVYPTQPAWLLGYSIKWRISS